METLKDSCWNLFRQKNCIPESNESSETILVCAMGLWVVDDVSWALCVMKHSRVLNYIQKGLKQGR